jgi:hypothetical protein
LLGELKTESQKVKNVKNPFRNETNRGGKDF